MPMTLDEYLGITPGSRPRLQPSITGRDPEFDRYNGYDENSRALADQGALEVMRRELESGQYGDADMAGIRREMSRIQGARVPAQRATYQEPAPSPQPRAYTLEDYLRDNTPISLPGVNASRSWGTAAADTVYGLASGGAGLVKNVGDLYGLVSGDMQNPVSEVGDSAQKYWEAQKSPFLQERIRQRQSAMDSAEGVLGKGWAALKGTVTDPALAMDTAANNVATLLPGGIVGRTVAGAKYGADVARGVAAGVPNLPGAATTAAKWGTAAAVGTGAVQQGADVSGDVYESVMQKPNEVWAANPEFMAALRQELLTSPNPETAVDKVKREFATRAARATFAPAAAVSVAANAIPGATMLERTLVGGAARQTAKEGARFGIVGRAATGALGEMGQEGIEEGGGAFFGNVAKQRYIDPNQDLMEKVGENAGMGMAGGLMMGGFGGAMHRSAPTPAPINAPTHGETLESGGAVDPLTQQGQGQFTTSRGFEDLTKQQTPVDQPLGDLTPDWTTELGAQSAPVDEGIDPTGMYRAPVGMYALREHTQPDMFGGGGEHIAEPQHEQGRPAFALDGNPTPQFNAPVQPDLFASGEPATNPQSGPTIPETPRGFQKGVTGQLPFSTAASPKAQIFLPIIDSLEHEGHMDEGTAIQARTLIAESKYAKAQKLIDTTLAERAKTDVLPTATGQAAQPEPAPVPANGNTVEPSGATDSAAPSAAPAPVKVTQLGAQKGKGKLAAITVGDTTYSIKRAHIDALLAMLGMDEQGHMVNPNPPAVDDVKGGQNALNAIGKDRAWLDSVIQQYHAADETAAMSKMSEQELYAGAEHDSEGNADLGSSGYGVHNTLQDATRDHGSWDNSYKAGSEGRQAAESARKQADAMDAQAKKSEPKNEQYDPTTDEMRDKNVARGARQLIDTDQKKQQLLDLVPSGTMRKLALEYDVLTSDGETAFNDLPIGAKFDWITGIAALEQDGLHNDEHELSKLQREIERDYPAGPESGARSESQGNSSGVQESVRNDAGQVGRSAGRTTADVRTEASRQEAASRPDPTRPATTESTATKTAEGNEAGRSGRVDNGKRAWDALVIANPDITGFPAWEALTGRQQSQVRDLESRGELNLAAANTVASGGNDAVFAQSTKQAGSISIKPEEAQSVVDAVLKGLGLTGKVDVTVGKNPLSVGLSDPASVMPAGGTSNGKVYLFSDNIHDRLDAFRTIFHELFHLGLSKSVDQANYSKALLPFLNDPLVRKMANEWKLTEDGVSRRSQMTANEWHALAVEEALAQLAEKLTTDTKGVGSAVKTAWVKRTASALANFADRIGLTSVAKSIREMTLTDAEKFVRDTILKSGADEKVSLRDSRFAQQTDATKSSTIPLDLPAPSELPNMGKVLSVISDKTTSIKHWMLGLMSNEQIADRFQEIPAVAKFAKVMNDMAATTDRFMSKGDTVKRSWDLVDSKDGKEESRRFMQFVMDASRAQMWVDDDHKTLSAAGNEHLNAADPNVVKEFNALRSRYASLKPEYKTLYGQINRHLAELRATKLDVIRSGLATSFATEGAPRDLMERAAKVEDEARDAFLMDNAREKTTRDTLRRMWRELDDLNAEFGKTRPGPYYPSMRFGDHIVYVKTKGFQAAEAAVLKAREALAELHNADNYTGVIDAEDEVTRLTSAVKRAQGAEKIAELKQRLAEAKNNLKVVRGPIDVAQASLSAAEKKLTGLKGDPEHYSVEFFESGSEARQRAEQLRGVMSDDVQIEQTLRNKYFQKLDAASPAFLNKMSDRIAAALPGADSTRLRQTMRELAYEMAPENSAVKANLRRNNVSGNRVEQVKRAFAANTMRDAWAIGRLAHKAELDEHLNELRFSNDEMSKVIGEEFAKRALLNMEYTDKPWVNAAANLSFMKHLALSPSYFITNVSQPWFISAPIMAARHGGKAVSELGKAWRQAAKMITLSHKLAGGGWNVSLNIEAAAKNGLINAGEAAMLNTLAASNKIDITVRHDLGVTARGEDGKLGNWLNKAGMWASIPAQQVEMVNRVSTALAAYRAEMQKSGGNAAQSIAYADKIVSETHLNYAPENRARLIHPNSWGGWGKVMFQFKAYQQGMAYLTIKNMLGALKHATTPEQIAERREARRAIAFLGGTMLGTGGLAAMPGAAAIYFAMSVIAKAFSEDGDDDDPEIEQIFRRALGDGTVANIATQGALSTAIGVDLGSRTGLGQTFSIAPFADTSKHGRDLAASYWLSVTGGAALGMVADWAEAINAVNKGNYAKASSFVLPRVMADGVKAWKLAEDGQVDSRGNTYRKPEDVGAQEVAAKMLGFSSVEMATLGDKRHAYLGERQAIKDTRNNLIKRAVSGDDMDDAIQAFNDRQPSNRITRGDIMKAKVSKQRYERGIRDGLPVGKRDKDIADRYEVR